MCGIAAYGNLEDTLNSAATLHQTHGLESVKILPPDGFAPKTPNQGGPELYGQTTQQAASRAEINAPNKQRVFCMAVTSDEQLCNGRPTSWSAALDTMAAGTEDEQRRLFIVSAGNTRVGQVGDYPRTFLEKQVEDPAQSWNALTVGAYTTKCWIDTEQDNTYSGYKAVAPPGGLSPFSATSRTWDKNLWPIKPDLLAEGGNLAEISGMVTHAEDFSVLTTHYRPQDRLFECFTATSAATARVAWMAAKIQHAYDNAWPETIRGLLVHSARWTKAMTDAFLTTNNKAGMGRLLQVCGYGVPDLNGALTTAANSLTLIAQEEIQPFTLAKGRGTSHEMHLHSLPWPKETLLALGSLPITIRVTLSYFVEPGPGEVGWQHRYRYPSHGLRFDLNRATENADDFLKRKNAATRAVDWKNPGGATSDWEIGQFRDKGSVHADRWQGTAADAANRNLIAVYPAIGWWRERKHLGCVQKKTRYALIVSILTEEQNLDLYSLIQTPLKTKVAVAASARGTRRI